MNLSRFTFRRHQRLSGKLAFGAVFDAGVRKSIGPLLVRGKPNDLGYDRLGLTVPRRVGNSVRRHHIKRMLREAFRLSQHELPGGFDFVLVVRSHEPLQLEDYQRILLSGASSIRLQWERRRKRSDA